jgi:hypothetical protein
MAQCTICTVRVWADAMAAAVYCSLHDRMWGAGDFPWLTLLFCADVLEHAVRCHVALLPSLNFACRH